MGQRIDDAIEARERYRQIKEARVEKQIPRTVIILEERVKELERRLKILEEHHGIR